MEIGSNIKKLRLEKNLTQKDLADLLHVTSQAVSRWENNEVEPGLDTVKKMSEIFSCSIDAILNVEESAKENIDNENEDNETSPSENKKEEQKVVRCFCKHCDKTIFVGDKYYRVIKKHHHRSGRSTRVTEEELLLCPACKEKYDKKEKQEQDNKIKYAEEKRKKKNMRNYILSSIVGLVLFIITLVIGINISNGDAGIIFAYIGIGLVAFYVGFATLYCYLIDSFILEVFETIAEYGFVKFPGIIFTFDLDGLKFLIAMKLLFAVLGFILAAAALAFAISISAFLAVFAFPFYAIKNSRQITELSQVPYDMRY